MAEGPDRVEQQRDQESGAYSSATAVEEADPVAALGMARSNSGRLKWLQRTAGNRAVAGALRDPDSATRVGFQRAPNQTGSGAHAPSHSGAAHATPFRSYADLFGGFQELVGAAINREGAGLDAVAFGHGLTAAHRALLTSVREVLVEARGAQRRAHQRAAARWRPLAAKLRSALAEARRLGLSSEAAASVADDIDLLERDYVRTHKTHEQIATELMGDEQDAMQAMLSLIYEFERVGEQTPGTQREEVEGRKDATVPKRVLEDNARVRAALEKVDFGKVVGRHATILAAMRRSLILARSEAPNSAFRAEITWEAIEPDLRHIWEQGSHLGAQEFEDDPAQITKKVTFAELNQKLEHIRQELAAHRAMVHRETALVALREERSPERIKAQQTIEKTAAPEVVAMLKEGRATEDMKHALDIIEHHITPSPYAPGESIITSGKTVVRIRNDEAETLRATAQKQVKDYMAQIVKAMVEVWMEYDSIKRANSAFKLHVLGGWGGADDPGNPEHFKNSAIRVRDEIVYKLADEGKYLEAFQATLNQKATFEQVAKDVGDYDRDLDKGYSRLSTTMTVIQVTLAALMPAVGTEAVAAGYGVATVAGTATAAGGGGALVAETGRQVVAHELYGTEMDPGLIAHRTGAGAALGASAAGPGITNKLAGVLAPGAEGSTAVLAKGIASTVVGTGQSLATGGNPYAGALTGALGTVAGEAGAFAKTPLAQGGVGAAIGYTTAKLTHQDALSGTVSGFVGSFAGAKMAQKGAGGEETSAGTRPALGEGESANAGSTQEPTVPAAPTGEAAPAAPAGETTSGSTTGRTSEPTAAGTSSGPSTQEETWMGRASHSDLPEEPVGAAIGRGIPKVNSREVATPDAVLKEGVGVGNMFTPIKRGVMKPIGKPGGGSSESVVMVNVTTGQKYLFKPIGGEPPVWYAEQRGVVAGHYAERAHAAAISAGELGVGTPEVSLVEINGRKGSLTKWVDSGPGGEVMGLDKFAARDAKAFEALQQTPEFAEALSGIQALDYLVNNVDRVNNLGNYMIEVGPEGSFKSLIPIDQELSFTSTGRRAIIPGKTSFMPGRWTPELAEHVAALHDDPAAFVTKIRPLVGDKAVSGVLYRLNQLYADGVNRGAIRPPQAAGAASAPAGPAGAPMPLAGGGATAATGQPQPLAVGGETAATGQPAPIPAGGPSAATRTATLNLREDEGGGNSARTVSQGQTKNAPAIAGSAPAESIPGGVTIEDDGIATTVRSRQDPTAVVRIEVEGNAYKLTDIYRRSLPGGSGALLLGEGLRALKAGPGGQLVIHGIINPETVEAYKQGAEPSASKLGKTAARGLELSGLAAHQMRWETIRGKLCIVVEF